MFVVILQKLVFFVATQNGCILTKSSFNNIVLRKGPSGGKVTDRKCSDERLCMFEPNINC
jgi:hypothetical protein